MNLIAQSMLDLDEKSVNDVRKKEPNEHYRPTSIVARLSPQGTLDLSIRGDHAVSCVAYYIGRKNILREGEKVGEGMKSRKVLVSITLRTDTRMKWLNNKRRWQNLLNVGYYVTRKPLYHDFHVEKVDAVKLR